MMQQPTLDADGQPELTIENTMLALVRQTTRIADSMNAPPPTMSRQQIVDAWNGLGMRVYEDEVVELLKKLGVEVAP